MKRSDLDPLPLLERVRLLTSLIDERAAEIDELSGWRREAIVELAAEGVSFAEIGRAVGLSRDRISRLAQT